MHAARKAGAGGGTIINARGTGREEDVKFFGITIVPEKELVLILAEQEKAPRILEAIRATPLPDRTRHGIAFCIGRGTFRFSGQVDASEVDLRARRDRRQASPASWVPILPEIAACSREPRQGILRRSAKRHRTTVGSRPGTNGTGTIELCTVGCTRDALRDSFRNAGKRGGGPDDSEPPLFPWKTRRRAPRTCT